MIKQIVGDLSARLLRAAVGRIATDIELISVISAATSTARLVDEHMNDAKACSSRIDVLRIAFDAAKLDGFVCELGVYRGDSLNEIAKYYAPQQVHGFDTFTGLPEHWREGFSIGAFDVSSEHLKFEENCVLHRGLFDESLPVFLEKESGSAKLIHIDCDLYSSTASALSALAPRVKVGTVIVFDEFFNYPGWGEHEYKAFLEFVDVMNINYKYIAYNKLGQQAAVLVTEVC